MVVYWPSWRYRAGLDGEIEGQIFEAEHHVPEGEGWVDSPALVTLPARPEAINSLVAPINFDGMSDDDLKEIAAKAGVKIDKRWGRKRLEDALRNAE
jgi:hypothetical protein